MYVRRAHPGYNIIVPLHSSEGEGKAVVLVNRGWVPRAYKYVLPIRIVEKKNSNLFLYQHMHNNNSPSPSPSIYQYSFSYIHYIYINYHVVSK